MIDRLVTIAVSVALSVSAVLWLQGGAVSAR